MIFSQLVTQARIRKQLTQRELAQAVKVSPATISNIESSSQLHIPKDSVIEALISRLDLDADDVWQAVGNQKAAPYHSGISEFKEAPDFSPVPVVGQVTAGSTIEAPEWTDGGFPTGSGFDTELIPVRRDESGTYGLCVSGDSMEPVFANGDYVFAAPNKEPRNNSFAVVRLISGEVFLKRILINDQVVILQSANPAYQTITVSRRDIEYIHPITLHRFAG